MIRKEKPVCHVLFRHLVEKKKKEITKMSWVNPKWMEAAILEAKQGLAEGGLPIGSVLVDPLSGVEGIKTARVI